MPVPHPPNKPYEDVPDYVPRTVRDNIRGISRPLLDFVTAGDKRLILYSDAQCGKTFELKHLAALLHESPLFTPILFTLDEYEPGKTLDEQLQYSRRSIAGCTPVVLLDGYDELPDSEKKSVSKQILSLADYHPEAVVLMSCRTSYESTTGFYGFKALYLDGLDIRSTKDFLQLNSCRPEELLSEIMEKEYFAVTSGPFFLKEVVKYYNAHGKLPANKSELYESFIYNICTENGKRGLWKYDTRSFKSKALPLLKKIAFSMVLSQEKTVSFDRIQEDLKISRDDAEVLRDCPLLTLDENRGCSFIHNAFKEYLAAIVLSELDKASILRIICYPGSEILRPSMQNTLILLLDNIPETSLTRKQMINWLVSQDSELLVRCGGELLDIQTRQQIFKEILLNHKKEDLLLGFRFSDQLMGFCNTRESVGLLCEELFCSDAYSRHLANILELLSSARIELLPVQQRDKLTERVFRILDNNIADKEHGNIFAGVLDNVFYQNKDTLDRFLELIGDSDNPYYIRQAIEITFNIGLCDEYAGWIIANYKKIHNFYIPGTNINHMVFDNISEKAMSAMQQPSNIINALSSIYSDRDCEEPSKEKASLISKLLENLEQKARITDISAPLHSMLRSLEFGHIGELLLKGCGAVFNICGGETLFDDQLAKVIEAFRVFADSKDSGCFLAEMNVLSCMINPTRLRKTLNDEKMKDNHLEAICSWFLSYPVSDEIRKEIRSHFKMPEPESEQDRKQRSFDEMFKVKKGRDLISSLPTSDTLGAIQLRISDNQRNTISLAVKDVLRSDKPIRDSHFLSVIAYYEPSLDDAELMKLFPFLHIQVRYLPKRNWNDEHWGSHLYSHCHFILYIEDHISDMRVMDQRLAEIAASDKKYRDEFIETCTRYIINRRRKHLYACLESMIARIEWSGTRITLCVEIANKIEGGFSMIRDYVETSFDAEDQLLFYGHALFSIEESILNTEEKRIAVRKIEEVFQKTKTPELKRKALTLLVRSGHPEWLDRALEYLKENPEWIKAEDFPSLHEYSYEYLEKIEQIFALACEVPYHPHYRTNSFERSLDALKRIGSSTVLARDRVVDLMRHKADSTTHNELYYYARETLDKFYEDNNPAPSFKEAGEVYDNLITQRI